MEKIAFKMQFKAGSVREYKRRHDSIWPELVVLSNAYMRDYSIFLGLNYAFR